MSGENRDVVITAVGPDRPGLIQEISSAVHAVGANLEDSRMAVLGGEFAVIVLCSGKPAALDRLLSESDALGRRLGLTLSFKETNRPTAAKDYAPYRLVVSGVDRPGIVASITKILAGHEINVASLESRVYFAPLSGTPMFAFHADLEIPSQTVRSILRKELSAVCDDENLDFNLEVAEDRRRRS